jgi:hypothetical protein
MLISYLICTLILLQERGNVGTNRSYGPLPGESTFVVLQETPFQLQKLGKQQSLWEEEAELSQQVQEEGLMDKHKGEEERGNQLQKIQEQVATLNQFQILMLPVSQMKWL